MKVTIGTIGKAAVRAGAMLAAVAMLSGGVSAQGSRFHQVSPAPGVTIELPRHWPHRSREQNLDAAAAAEAMMGQEQHVAVLSAHSLPAPHAVNVRFSFVEGDDYDQDDLRVDLRDDRPALMAEMEQEYAFIISQLRDTGAVEVTRTYPVTVAEVGSLTAFALSYERTSQVEPSRRFTVTQYLMPLGDRTAILTLSLRVGDEPMMRPILERVRSSLRIAN